MTLPSSPPSVNASQWKAELTVAECYALPDVDDSLILLNNRIEEKINNFLLAGHKGSEVRLSIVNRGLRIVFEKTNLQIYYRYADIFVIDYEWLRPIVKIGVCQNNSTYNCFAAILPFATCQTPEKFVAFSRHAEHLLRGVVPVPTSRCPYSKRQRFSPLVDDSQASTQNVSLSTAHERYTPRTTTRCEHPVDKSICVSSSLEEENRAFTTTKRLPAAKQNLPTLNHDVNSVTATPERFRHLFVNFGAGSLFRHHQYNKHHTTTRVPHRTREFDTQEIPCRNEELDSAAADSLSKPRPSAETSEVISAVRNIRLNSINGDEVKTAAGGGSSTSANGEASDSGQTDYDTDIETALRNEAEAQKFLEFLNQQYCSENLYFYLSVQKYKALSHDDAHGRRQLGNQIFERHFAQNCNEPVNVEYATNKAILDAKRTNDFRPDTYDHAQYQIFHLLKYDVWPRYMRAEGEKRSARCGGDNDVSSEHTETSSCGDSSKSFAKRPQVGQGQLRYCMVLSADSVSSEKEVLADPLISVKKWTEMMAQRRGMDKQSTEVVDAQTGSTIDPARQAIDALNNRHVRLMPVVRFAVDFLAPTLSSKNSSPIPAKVVMLRVRQGLTLNKVLKPLLIKYNFDPSDVVICFAGTCDPLHLSTTVASITPRMITVMTQQQFKDRKLLPKREYQKELLASPLLSQNQETNFPYFQHGDIAFYELPTDTDSKGQKHSAIRSHSTNPRFQELFKFGRKASQAKSKSDTEQSGPSVSNDTAASGVNKTGDRRKSVATSGRSAPTPASVAPSDIPYCGEATITPDDPKIRNSPVTQQKSVNFSYDRVQQSLSKEHDPTPGQCSKRAASYDDPGVPQKSRFDMPEYMKAGTNIKSISDANGNAPRVPAIYASAIRSDKEVTSPTEDKIAWYADYV